MRPALILSHIPIYADLLKIPILVLPGKASIEFGDLLGIKSVAAAMFLSPCSKSRKTGCTDEESDVHMYFDSFVNFAISRIPK